MKIPFKKYFSLNEKEHHRIRLGHHHVLELSFVNFQCQWTTSFDSSMSRDFFPDICVQYLNHALISKLNMSIKNHLSLLASLSLSMSSRTSPILTRPLTFLIRCLLSASFPEIKMTLTWVIPPLDPVRPSNWVTLALTG